jgi:hypothetical protein
MAMVATALVQEDDGKVDRGGPQPVISAAQVRCRACRLWLWRWGWSGDGGLAASLQDHDERTLRFPVSPISRHFALFVPAAAAAADGVAGKLMAPVDIPDLGESLPNDATASTLRARLAAHRPPPHLTL